MRILSAKWNRSRTHTKETISIFSDSLCRTCDWHTEVRFGEKQTLNSCCVETLSIEPVTQFTCWWSCCGEYLTMRRPRKRCGRRAKKVWQHAALSCAISHKVQCARSCSSCISMAKNDQSNSCVNIRMSAWGLNCMRKKQQKSEQLIHKYNWEHSSLLVFCLVF